MIKTDSFDKDIYICNSKNEKNLSVYATSNLPLQATNSYATCHNTAKNTMLTYCF